MNKKKGNNLNTSLPARTTQVKKTKAAGINSLGVIAAFVGRMVVIAHFRTVTSGFKDTTAAKKGEHR